MMKRTIFLFGVLAFALVILTGSHGIRQTQAQAETRNLNPTLPNYDIRTDNSVETTDALTRFRQISNKDAVAVASLRDGFVEGENLLRQKVPALKVEYNEDLRIPEVIGPDVRQGINFLTSSSAAERYNILLDFIKENSSLLGVSEAQANQLELTADYKNPEDDLSFVRLEQKINGVPVFRGEIKAGLTKQNEIIRVINNLASGLDYESLSTDFRNSEDAVRAAFRQVMREITTEDTQLNVTESTDLKAKFGSGDWATTAEKMYFPTEPGVAVPAWQVIIWEPVNVYMVIVDAETGMMLWRKNATEEQTQAATYNVYTNPNSMINVANNPSPLEFPGLVLPTFPTQGVLKTRTNITRVGNEAPYTFNSLGWITNGNNTTDGNAVEAGLDRVAPDGIDATQAGSPNRVFSSGWNPPPGNPAPGDNPLTPQAQRGAVIQMFYIMNLYHDELYRFGFTEQAHNFQHNNFGRGGLGNDRISAQVQDSSGTNNANFSSNVPDGTRGRIQMYLWNGPNPDRDGAADAEVVIHEATHGTSTRLIGNGTGLTKNMPRGLGEGWSDFYAHALLSGKFDLMVGVYPMGAYATHLFQPGYNSNYYYGIRRFPKALLNATGSNGKPYNPLTFRYLNGNCDNLIGTTATNPNSAFPRNPAFATSSASQPCDQVHNAGEIWSSALWEGRAKLVARLGWEQGNRKSLQIVTTAMNMTPLNPSFLQARDAVIAATYAIGTAADILDVWEGFRLRGMGFNASIQNTGTGQNDTIVTENFDAPPPPIFSVNPGSLSFTAIQTGSNPAGKTVRIDITPGDTVDWSGTDSATWLSITPTSGQAPYTATVSVDIAGLTPGNYFNGITIKGTGINGTTKTVFVPVMLTINPSPISVNPTSLSFTAFSGGANPPNRSVGITNSGHIPLFYNTTDDASWLSISPNTGQVPVGTTNNATVSINTAGLGLGTYNGKVTINASVSGVTKIIPVTLTIIPVPPVISVNPGSLSASDEVGGRNTFSLPLSITNSGAGTLKWTATDNAGWLSVSPLTANVPAGSTVVTQITFNSSGLDVGSYFGEITISAPGAATKTVPVELKITSPTQ